MPGFPTRPSRAAFGPVYVNRSPIRQPSRDVGADALNLLAWQTAGLGVVGERAWALLNWDGTTLTLAASGECWDASGLVVPAISRISAGVYVVTYEATYPDEIGAVVSTNLVAAEAFAQATADLRTQATVNSDHRTVNVRVRDAAGTATDITVLLKVR